MGRDIKEIRQSLENRIKGNIIFNKGIKILKQIIEDFDKLPENEKILILDKKVSNEIIKKNSVSYKNGIVRGLNQSRLNLDLVEEFCNKPSIQLYKKRNQKKWDEIMHFGFWSRFIIAWGVSYRRKAIPVFLENDWLPRFGFSKGLEEPKEDFSSDEAKKYYDKSEYPPLMPSEKNVKWYSIRLTRGMRHQLQYLIKEFMGDILKEKNLTEDKHDEIAIDLYKNPVLLETIFESTKKLKDKHKVKVSELESEMLAIYKDLNSEKKKEHLSKIEALNLLDKIGGKIEKIEHYNDKWKIYRNEWIEIKIQFGVKDGYAILKAKYPNDKNLNKISPESFNRAINKWLKNH